MKPYRFRNLIWLVIAGVLVLSPAASADPPTPLFRASFDEKAPAGAERTGGVHGAGIRLAGQHRIEAAIGPTLKGIEKLTLSAWVKPAAFDRYNEILRQECPQRLLFSFQENGKLLSLGLNVKGYAECDAPLPADAAAGGAWRHAAATFDGEFMRVYFDGRQIGELPRPGTPAFDPSAPAFIGSQSGNGEFFTGEMDEVELYGEALSATGIWDLYDRGIRALLVRQEKVLEQLSKAYAKRPTFAATLAALGKSAQPPELVALLNHRLRSDFPEEFDRFAEAAGRDPVNTNLDDVIRRQLALLTEYQPLTAEQKSRQSPEERTKQATLDALLRRGETWLGTPGDRKIEDGLDLIFTLDEHIVHRPVLQEAVAPYVPPATPPLTRRTAEEARELIRNDWLFQAGGQVTGERIRDELGWTRALAQRLGAPAGKELDAIEQTLKSGPPAEALESLYFELRALKRRIHLAHPAIDFSEILLVDMPFPQGKEWKHETRHRLGYMAVPGGRLMVLSGLDPAAPLRQLMPQPPLHGSFWRPDLSWDGKRVVFCFKPHNEKSFHLYEINADGSGLRQLTGGPYDDLDPIYLPDGENILFSTTRGHTYVRCMPPTNAYILARCDRNGENLYIVSRNNEPDYLPSVLDDGRVIYTRWEYTDKPLWRAQGLWTMNPDGTQVNTLWGNQSVWPDLIKDARAIPGSTRILFTGSAHHNWFSGSLGIIDPAKGLNFPDGITKITAETDWPESGNGPVDPVESPDYHSGGAFSAYYSPCPITGEDFLVSAERNGKFALYLMDIFGNRELIHEGANQVLHAIPLRPRPRPPVIPEQVSWPKPGEKPKDGICYSRDIYEGMAEEVRGKARYLRVLAIQPKTYTYWHKRPYLSTGPVVSAVQSDGVKEILGTVPIREDGSVAFSLPSGKALHFQLLDEEHRALQTMRSFTGVMPGEMRGCVGCHENHGKSPKMPPPAEAYAAVKDVSRITPPPWEDRTVSWARYVRPVLDRYCVDCHRDDEKARAALELSSRPGKLDFDEIYWLFTGHPSWGTPYEAPAEKPPGFGIAGMLMVEGYGKVDPAGYRTPPPMTALSYKSRLIEIAGSGSHYEVKVDPVNLRRLKVWVDAMCPYRGEEEIREIPDPEFQGVDWLAIRPRVQTAPVIQRPGPIE